VEYRKVHLEKKNVMVWGTRICLSFDLHQYRFEHSLQTLLVTLTALPLTMTHISFSFVTVLTGFWNRRIIVGDYNVAVV